MKIEPSQVERPLRKLRKMLNEFPVNPKPEEVHDLRTQTRRLEATVTALVLGQSKKPRRLLKAITPVRKAAGKVRDMDVLIGDALMLAEHHHSAPLVRLVEHLVRMRSKNARKLRSVITSQRKETSRRLRQSSKLVKRRLNQDAEPTAGEAAPQILMRELSHWPELNAGNLHEFRIRIKELRYILQLTPEVNPRLTKRLDEVKNAIGEWHDWVELHKIAKKVLAPDPEGVLQRIENIAHEKFRTALTTANQTRHVHFELSGERKGGTQGLHVIRRSA